MVREPDSGSMSMEETDASERIFAGSGGTARGKEVLSQGGKNCKSLENGRMSMEKFPVLGK